MATTGSNFVSLLAATLVNTTVQAVSTLVAYMAADAARVAQNGGGKVVDKVTIDFSNDGFAKHGGANYQLTGTTAQTIDLTDLTANTPTSSAGDTTFAKWNTLVFNNLDAADVTIAPGGSNPARLLLSGTGPTLTIPANTSIALSSLAGLVIDSTHKIITVTPTSGGNTAGNFFIGVAGS